MPMNKNLSKQRICRTWGRLILTAAVALLTAIACEARPAGSAGLFPESLPVLKFQHFSSEGYSKPVSGVIYDTRNSPCCGVPMGGISTGCIDIETSGVLGFNSAFNSYPRVAVSTNVPQDYYPRRFQLMQPFLGLSVDGKTTVLASRKMLDGGMIQTCKEPAITPMTGKPYGIVKLSRMEGLSCANEIRYFGHYPVADLVYDLDGPIEVSTRAWAPFIPGDAVASSTPGAVFEVQLFNRSNQVKRGTVVMTFPGPTPEEAGSATLERKPVNGAFSGVSVEGAKSGYALGIAGAEALRIGGGLGRDSSAWSHIQSKLPDPSGMGASAAVDFSLKPEQRKTVRFVLTWYCPRWNGNDGHKFVRAYTSFYTNASDAAEKLAANHASLLKRVIAWQQVIYSDRRMPVWLKEALISSLYLIPEDSYWARPMAALDGWPDPRGLFALIECPRGCPQMEVTPCSWYGNFPIVYFFPELATLSLRGYVKYMRDDGAVTVAFGAGEDIASPTALPYAYQETLNGCCFADMVNRVWLCTGDDAVLREFYPAVKKNTIYTVGLNKKKYGVVRMSDGPNKQEWFEHVAFPGLAAHIGSVRLAHMAIVERMAEKTGDQDFAKQCKAWLEDGQEGMEKVLWKDGYYQSFNEPESGKHSGDVVMANQLDGQWMAKYHGLPGILPKERVDAALALIKRVNIPPSPCGAVDFVRSSGSPIQKGVSLYAGGDKPGEQAKKDAENTIETKYGTYSMFTPELIILAMTYMYEGQKDFGLELARRSVENLSVKQLCPWDLPNMVHADSGKRMFGSDYGQNMQIWAMPAAVYGGDIKGLCATDGLIDRMLRAANPN